MKVSILSMIGLVVLTASLSDAHAMGRRPTTPSAPPAPLRKPITITGQLSERLSYEAGDIELVILKKADGERARVMSEAPNLSADLVDEKMLARLVKSVPVGQTVTIELSCELNQVAYVAGLGFLSYSTRPNARGECDIQKISSAVYTESRPGTAITPIIPPVPPIQVPFMFR